MRRIAAAAALVLVIALPRLAIGACVGTDVYSRMICASGNVAHYWRMDAATSGSSETDHFGPSYSSGVLTYINTSDVTVQTTSLIPLDTDKSVTFGGHATTPGFALTNSLASAELNPKPTTNYTLEMWFSASSLSGTRYLATVSDSLQYNMRLFASNSGNSLLAFQVWNGTPGTCNSTTALNFSATNAFSTSTTYYVVVESATSAGTWATNGAKIYINNALENTATGSGNVCSTDHRFYVGIEGQDRNGQFAGVIDDVVIYDRILTAQERTDHYQGFPTGASGAVRRIIEGKMNVPRIRPPDRLIAGLPKIFVDGSPRALEAINRRLLTGPPSPYHHGSR